MIEEIEPEIYEAFRKYIYEKAGIALGPAKQALVAARIGKRLRALGLASSRAYYEYLVRTNDENEIVQLLDVISTNTTSFFREGSHFDRLQNILLEWHAKGKTRFRIWCAAASTGEEPYTLSMICNEYLPIGKVDLKILATDISTKVLKQCMEGEYNQEKLSTVPPHYQSKYFEHSDRKGYVKVQESLQKPLTFARMNLMETPYPMKGPFDIIFCRNVMIYFDRQGRQTFVDEAARLLAHGGYLFTGHSESISGFSAQLKSLEPSVYQRI